MKKRVLSLMLVLAMAIGMFAGCGSKGEDAGNSKVAMITDYGDITDQSFNQTTYEVTVYPSHTTSRQTTLPQTE